MAEQAKHTAGPKEYRWDRGHWSPGVLGDCWSVWWRDPARKDHFVLIERVATLKEVHAAVRNHRAAIAKAEGRL